MKSILLATLALGWAAGQLPRASETLVRGFLDALNSKEQSALKPFVESSFGPNNPVDDWIRRLTPLAKQGAPFKLVRMADSTSSTSRALIEDREGIRLSLTLSLADAKITGVMITDPEALNAPPPKDYRGWTDLATLAEAVRKDTESPAIAVAIGQDGKEIELATSGVRRLGKPDAVDPSDRWHIGSIGKPITSTLIGVLIDQGKLRWDTTLKEALPDVPMKPEYERVNLLEIMRHRGRIPRDMGFTFQRVQEIVGDETDPVKMRARYANDVLSRGPLPPGFAYSNAGYALLGHIAERTMGKPFEELVAELVFAPLGMKTALVGRKGLPADGPSGHAMNEEGLEPFNMEGPLGVIIAPAGDMSMSPADLVRFGRAHLDGLRGKDGVLKAATAKKLHEAIAEDEGGPQYACGWSVGPLMGTAVRHGHNGSNGTFRAELAIFPDAGLVIAAIVNRGGEAEPSPALQAVRAVAQRYAPKN